MKYDDMITAKNIQIIGTLSFLSILREDFNEKSDFSTSMKSLQIQSNFFYSFFYCVCPFSFLTVAVLNIISLVTQFSGQADCDEGLQR